MRLSLKVIPNAKQNKIVEESGRMKVYLTAPPVEGKANRALVEFLAEHYKVKKRDVRIVKGETSREKIVKIAGLVCLLISVLALSACAPRKEPAPPSTVAFNKFPVLEYHLIGRPEGRWQRTPENFRADLEWLHANGYYPLNLKDVLSGFKGVPGGKTPVVLTFDDSTSGQFRYLPDGTIDPDCAVGILKAFHEKHPKEWPLRATFFVLIETSDPDHNLFGQPELAAKKLRQLTEWGMEIGTHTYSHDRLDKISPAAAHRSIERSIRTLTKYVSQEIVSLSLPQGFYPKDMSVLGDFKLLAEVAGGMNPARFDPLHIKRIQAIGPEWKKFFKRE